MPDFKTKLKEIVLKLYEIHALKFGDFKMKVGVNSPVYLDLRVVVSYPELMEKIAVLLWEFHQEEVECEHVCGVPYTALPVATLISTHFRIPMLMRRKESKQYGTRKLVEGRFSVGDRCVIVEDVVTSGSSILETYQDLQKEGLNVSHVLVIVDRQQGGSQVLAQHGLKMKSLLTLGQIMQVLCEAGCVDGAVVDSVTSYLTRTQFTDNSLTCNILHKPDSKRAAWRVFEAAQGTRLRMTFSQRADVSKCAVARKLLRLMAEKETLLCVAADVTTSSQLLQLADAVGPHICVLKTHVDIVEDFSDAVVAGLLDLASKHKFFIMEDRKFADIGHVVALQYSKGMHHTASWADIVTAHPVSGEGVLSGLESALSVLGPEVQRACFLVAEMSSRGHLASPDYIAGVVQLALGHPHLVCGLVCQSPNIVSSPGMLQLTPGVHLDAGSDQLAQTYHSPQDAVLARGADVAVVGRGVTSAEEGPGEAARRYRHLLWTAYLERVASCDT